MTNPTVAGLRIAVVHNFHRSDSPSGEDVVVHAEVDALRRAGHRVEVVSVSNDGVGTFGRARAAVTVATGRGRSPLDALGSFRPDVIHVHNLFPNFGRRWVDQADAPVVVTQHNYRPSCATGYLFRDGVVCTDCIDGDRWAGVRHACYRGSRIATIPLALAGRHGAGGDPLLARADRIIALSEKARDILERDGVDAGRVVRDHHFVLDALRPASSAPGPAGGGDGYWLFVGRLSPEKGLDELLCEWPSEVELVVVGDGDEREHLTRRAADLPVRFLGQRPRTEVLQLLDGARGLVLPSRWYETFGLVRIEALAVGVPCLTFDPCVAADFVREEGTGLVGSWGSVADAVAEASETFPALRDRCRQVFDERYTETAFVNRRTALYRSLLATG